MRTRIFIGSFISILLAFLVTIPESCYRKFYKVANGPHAENIDSTIQLQNQKQKFFILRSGGDAFHMENVSMDNNSQSLTFTLRRLPPEHQLYLAVNKKSGIPFKQSNSSNFYQVPAQYR